MKKLFALLLLMPFLFVACDNDDDKKEETPYFNPVEGSWVNTSAYGNTETRTFTKEFVGSSIIKNAGSKADTTIYGKYTIDKETIKYQNSGNIYTYNIEKDTLLLRYPKSNWEGKYIKKK